MSAGDIFGLASIPLALILLGWEVFAARRRGLRIFDSRDVTANVVLSAGNRLAVGMWVAVEIVVLTYVGDASPLHLGTGWEIWALGLVMVDLSTYWYHRAHHRVRGLWAIHVVHHSSTEMNLTIGIRRPPLVMTQLPFLVPLALVGFPPVVIAFGVAVSGFYTFPLHTTLVDRLPRWYEAIFNTPSHHRVHHASNPAYIDRNYGSILIVWDRLFGTFEPEVETPRFGLTRNITTFNPLHIATHEFVDMWRDMRADGSLRDRLSRLVRPPGWSPPLVAAAQPGKVSAVAPMGDG